MVRWMAACGAVAGLAGVAAGQEPLWEVRLATEGADAANAAAADGEGGVLVAGTTAGSLGGPSAGGQDVWVARFDSAGRRLWLRQFGTAGNDAAGAVSMDGARGVFVAGTTQGALGGPSGGGKDLWLARLDGGGSLLWLVQRGGTLDEVPLAVAPDGSGGAFLGGWILNGIGGVVGPWLARYDGAGSVRWLLEPPTLQGLAIGALAADGGGGIIAGGAAWPNGWVGSVDGFGRLGWSARHPGGFFLRPFWTGGLALDGSGGVFAVGGYDEHVGTPGSWLGRYRAGGEQVFFRWFPGRSMGSCVLGEDGDLFVGGDSLERYGPDGALIGALAAAPGLVYGMAWGQGGFFAVGGTGGGDAYVARYGVCYANCDGSTGAPVLSVNDYLCFLASFAAGEPYANCDRSTEAPVLNVNDFVCFANRWAAGCE